MKTLIAQILIIGVLVIMLSIAPNGTKIYSEYQNGLIIYPTYVRLGFDTSGEVSDVTVPNLDKFKYAKCFKYDRYIEGLEATDIEKSWLHLVMFCESSCNPNVLSPSGTYKGLYQYEDRTWNANCEGDIFNGFDQIDCTLKLYRQGEQWRWPVCGR